jgi:hypothetical protein
MPKTATIRFQANKQRDVTMAPGEVIAVEVRHDAFERSPQMVPISEIHEGEAGLGVSDGRAGSADDRTRRPQA